MREERPSRFGAWVVLLVLLVPASCAGASELSYRWLAERETVDVDPDSVPPSLPVLVLTGSADAPTPRVVPYGALESLRAERPDARWLVAEGREEGLRSALRERAQGSEARAIGSFEVEEREPGRQLIRASLVPGPGVVNAGWYEATEHGIRPLRHQSYEVPGVRFAALFIGFVASAVPALAILLWLDRRRRGRRLPPARAHTHTGP